MEKHDKIARAALASSTEDLVIGQMSQVSQILFPKATHCYHLTQGIENELTSPAARHRAEPLSPGPRTSGGAAVRLLCHPTSLHAPDFPLHSCSVAGAAFPTFRAAACPAALLHLGSFCAQREVNTNPKLAFKNQHSVKLPCCRETLQRISP